MELEDLSLVLIGESGKLINDAKALQDTDLQFLLQEGNCSWGCILECLENLNLYSEFY